MNVTWRLVAGLVLLVLLVRGGTLLLLRDNLQEDRDAYRSIAENLALHHSYGFLQPDGRPGGPTAYRPPLYPLILTLFVSGSHVSSAGVFVLHLLLGVATVLLTFELARRWHLRRWSLLAATLVACDPILLYWSTYVMTETLATFLAVACLLLLTRYGDQPKPVRAGLAGGSLALAVLCRPTFLVWLALVLVAVAPASLRRRRFKDLTAMAFVAVIVMLPWTLRTWRLFDRPILATTHGGYTLLLGNNRYFYQHLKTQSWNRVWDAEPFQRAWRTKSADLGELAADRYAYRVARQEIADDPAMFIVSCAVRVGRLWTPLPHQLESPESSRRRMLRVAVAVWYTIVFMLALIPLVSIRWMLLQAPWLWGTLLMLATTAIHLLYWSNMRMRAPLVPLVCILAAAGAQAVQARISRHKSFD